MFSFPDSLATVKSIVWVPRTSIKQNANLRTEIIYNCIIKNKLMFSIIFKYNTEFSNYHRQLLNYQEYNVNTILIGTIPSDIFFKILFYFEETKAK